MTKLKYWFDCKLRNKHRYSYYNGRCIVCVERGLGMDDKERLNIKSNGR